MKNLRQLNTQELSDFLNSFDYVLSDVDGVLRQHYDTIPGAQDAIKSLRKIGKKVVLVSNNTCVSVASFYQQLKSAGFEIEETEIVTPVLSTIGFLKKHNFDKEIFLLGMSAARKELENAGFKLVPNKYDLLPENIIGFMEATGTDDGSVGAVIADFDLNLTYANLQRAATYLQRPEVFFIKGATDSYLLGPRNKLFLGPGMFTNNLETMTKREGLAMGKPSSYLRDFIMERFKIEDPSRVLFIGDAIFADMGFATLSKYKKLLVLSGQTSENELMAGNYPEEYRPDYYADSLKTVNDVICDTFENNRP